MNDVLLVVDVFVGLGWAAWFWPAVGFWLFCMGVGLQVAGSGLPRGVLFGLGLEVFCVGLVVIWGIDLILGFGDFLSMLLLGLV